MKIVFSFCGGNMHDSVVAGASDVLTPDGHLNPATYYYLFARRAEIGRRFPVSTENGVEIYQVERRLESNNALIVRATFVVKIDDQIAIADALCEGRR
jgi:hypothetical protein